MVEFPRVAFPFAPPHNIQDANLNLSMEGWKPPAGAQIYCPVKKSTVENPATPNKFKNGPSTETKLPVSTYILLHV